MWRYRTVLLALGLTLVVAGEARAGAICTLDIRAGGTGTARCAGSIGKWTVDPMPVPAEVRQGWLRFYPRRLMSFDPRPTMTFEASWTASGPLVTGQGRIEGATVPFTGDVRSGAGAIQMELVLGDEREDSRAASALRRRGGCAAPSRGSRRARRCARRSGG